MGIGIGEHSRQQHLVGAEPGPRHHVARLEGGLLDLGVIIGGIAIQRQPANFDQWIVLMRPDFGQIERIEPIRFGILERHDLHVERPTGIVATLDRVVQITLMVVAIFSGKSVSFFLGETFNA